MDSKYVKNYISILNQLTEAGPAGYAGDDAAFQKYASTRATGDLLNREMQPEKGVATTVSPQARAVATGMTQGIAAQNPEMEKRYTMNKLTAPSAPAISPDELEEEEFQGIVGGHTLPPQKDEFDPQDDTTGNIEEDDLAAIRRLMKHR
jgi:hypothetical protein